MTPEERFTKIENALHALAEGQAGHDERIKEIENAIRALTEAQARHEKGIRSLVTVSRTLVDSQMRTDAQLKEMIGAQKRSHQELAGVQRHTDERLNALIEIVDKLLPRRGWRSLGPYKTGMPRGEFWIARAACMVEEVTRLA